jgi:prevent-host-death family protein
MTISLTEDFKTAAELKGQTEDILQQIQQTGRPLVITIDGKPAVVMMNAATYEQNLHNMNLARLLAEGEADVRAGRTQPLTEFFKELQGRTRRGKKVSR